MGSVGEVRGTSKIDTYRRYVEETERWEGSWYPIPASKKECKRLMEKDPGTGEWVLRRSRPAAAGWVRSRID